MVILSLDQALKVSGYAIYDNKTLIDYGAFSIQSSMPMSERLLQFWQELNNLYNQYDFDKIIYEDIQLQRGNAETYRKLAYVQAAILLWCSNQGIKCEPYAPSHWRSVLKQKYGIAFGKSRQEQKAISQQLVKDKFQIEATEDTCDAINIGLAYLVESDSEWN